jgi:hypothetical protein
MSNIKLIIQRTLNGLDIDYTTEVINEREFEASGILYDERKEVNQLNCEVVLSVTNTREYKVYSYINNNVSDVAKRKGFYAIRLIVPRNKRILSVYQLLQKIALRYDQHRVSNSINTLNYDDILQEINTGIQPIEMLLSSTICKVTCYSFIDFAAQSDEVLNNFKLELFHKTYLFDVIDKESEPLLKEVDMKDFKTMYSFIKEITIENPDSLLNGLWVNDVRLDYKKINTNTNILNLVCLNTDQIHYTSALENKKKLLSNNHLVLRRPQPIQRPMEINYSSSGYLSSGAYLLALIALLVGVSAGYFGGQYVDFPYFNKRPLEPVLGAVHKPINNTRLSINNVGSNAFLLEADSTRKDTLIKYFFKYDPKGPTWRFREKSNQNTEIELTKAELYGLFNKDTVKVNLFIEELKRYSPISLKDSIPSKPTSKATTETEKNTSTANASSEKSASVTIPIPES